MYKKIVFLLFVVLANGKNSSAMKRCVNTSDIDKILCGLVQPEDKETANKPEVSLGTLDQYDLCLCEAILQKDKTQIEKIIELFDLKTPIPYFGGSYLGLASQVGDESIVKLLKRSGAVFLFGDLIDETIPLHIAAYFGFSEIVTDLFKRFPNLKIAESLLKGDSALFLALYNGNYEEYKTAACIIKAGVGIDRVSVLFLNLNPDMKAKLGLQ